MLTIMGGFEPTTIRSKSEETRSHIDWVICTRANAYTNDDKRCNLCLTEKLCLINADRRTKLNKRLELAAKRRHENKFYLCNFARTVKWYRTPYPVSRTQSPTSPGMHHKTLTVSSPPHLLVTLPGGHVYKWLASVST